MLISIIIPTYNRAVFISSAISSVMEQTHKDFELIIVDNGSSDNTKEVVGEYSDDRIKYLYTSNIERSAARNYGFEHSKGQLICFLDSDEEVTTDYLKCFAIASEQNPDINVFRSRFEFHPMVGEMRTPLYDEEHEVLKIWKCFMPVASYCLRRNVCIAHSWPEEFWIWEDRHLFLRIALQEKILELPCITSVFTDHPGRSVNIVDPDNYVKRVEQIPMAVNDLWSTHGEELSRWIRTTDIQKWNHESLRGIAIDAIQANRPDLAKIALKKALSYTSMSLVAKWLYTYSKAVMRGLVVSREVNE